MASGPQFQTTITSPDVEGGSGAVRIRRVHVVFAPQVCEITLIALERDPLVVGRDPAPAGSLGLPDAEISRQHARFELTGDSVDGEWRIVDLGSRNGVWVDGVRTTAAPLRHGSVVRVGSSLLVFTDVELHADQPLAVERPGLLGRSLTMQRVRGEIELVGPRPVSVVILGETGVGKERVAEAIHQASGRAGKFVPVNCAGIPAGVAESELFGHVAGAFTGASGKSEGLFVAAHGGTLFLDEIGELPLPIQAKLLRALAAGEVRAVGAADVRKVDVRVIAATHRPLDTQVESGAFRADLWARLAGWRIDVPSLRDRREDILALAGSFLKGAAKLSPTAAEALLLHDWPFNVRELENLMAASVLRPSDGVIRAEHLPPALVAKVAHRIKKASTVPTPPPIEVSIDRSRAPNKEELEKVLKHFDGSVADTAEFFGKDRRQVYRWLEKFGIDPDSLRPAKPETGGDGGDDRNEA